MTDIQTILKHYFQILENKQKAKYLQTKRIPVSFEKNDPNEILWKKHNITIQKQPLTDNKFKQSLLDLKVELANRIFHECIFCERRCKINRREKEGNCKVKEARVASEFLHIGEERVLIPSYTIFFSGCTFHCVFCQNWDISQNICGIHYPLQTLAELINKRKQQGGININWVGGDPTSNLWYILQVLNELDLNIPQIWNSNMYCSTETMHLLNGIIDVYLTDFKYGNNQCAKRLSKVDDYFEIVSRNHTIAYKQGELIIRHLVLPNHVKCCSKPILQWISQKIPNITVNIMAQYRPEYHAYDYDDLIRPITREEYSEVRQYAEDLNLVLI